MGSVAPLQTIYYRPFILIASLTTLTQPTIKSPLPTFAMPPSADLEEQLKRALWLHIGRIVDAQTLAMGVNATPQFIAALMEATYAQIVNSGRDLESFAHHAGRDRIQVQDVMMLARRNEGLKEVLEEKVESVQRAKARKQAAGH